MALGVAPWKLTNAPAEQVRDVVELVRAHLGALSPPEEISDERAHDRVARWFDDAKTAVLAARNLGTQAVDGVLVFRDETHAVRIRLIAVRTARKGIGSALLRTLRQLAEGRGWEALRVTVDPTDAAQEAFYLQKQGFRLGKPNPVMPGGRYFDAFHVIEVTDGDADPETPSLDLAPFRTSATPRPAIASGRSLFRSKATSKLAPRPPDGESTPALSPSASSAHPAASGSLKWRRANQAELAPAARSQSIKVSALPREGEPRARAASPRPLDDGQMDPGARVASELAWLRSRVLELWDDAGASRTLAPDVERAFADVGIAVIRLFTKLEAQVLQSAELDERVRKENQARKLLEARLAEEQKARSTSETQFAKVHMALEARLGTEAQARRAVERKLADAMRQVAALREHAATLKKELEERPTGRQPMVVADPQREAAAADEATAAPSAPAAPSQTEAKRDGTTDAEPKPPPPPAPRSLKPPRLRGPDY